jgi:hypothetical protein
LRCTAGTWSANVHAPGSNDWPVQSSTTTSSPEAFLKTSPIQVVYGRDPPSVHAYTPGEARLPFKHSKSRCTMTAGIGSWNSNWVAGYGCDFCTSRWCHSMSKVTGSWGLSCTSLLNLKSASVTWCTSSSCRRVRRSSPARRHCSWSPCRLRATFGCAWNRKKLPSTEWLGVATNSWSSGRVSPRRQPAGWTWRNSNSCIRNSSSRMS